MPERRNKIVRYLFLTKSVYYKGMLDVELIRQDPEKVKAGISKKKADPKLIDDFLAVDKTWRELLVEIETSRAAQKKAGEERNIEEAKRLKEVIKTAEERIKEVEEKRTNILLIIPNIPDDDVPVGPDESGNVVLRKWGEPKTFDFEVKDHVELGEKLGLINIAKAGEVTGARFNYLMGDLARLEFGIVQMVFDFVTNETVMHELAEKIEPGYSPKIFTPVVPPVMIRPEVFRRMGRLDPGQEEERYYLPKDDLYLVGSAEHTLGPLHMDEIIPEENLPIRYMGFSSAFRRESGSYGKDVRGILRVHQFDKLEMESFCLPENSRKEQDLIVSIQEHLTRELNIPYQVISVCTGDMGGPDRRQIDMECWIPSQGRYRETHTSDMMADYQSRRLQTKVRRKDGKLEYVHMNDATAFAIGRILIAIVENNQTADGKINVPKALQKYIGKEVIG